MFGKRQSNLNVLVGCFKQRNWKRSFLGIHKHPKKPSVRNEKLVGCLASSIALQCLNLSQQFRFEKGALCQVKRNALGDVENQKLIITTVLAMTKNTNKKLIKAKT